MSLVEKIESFGQRHGGVLAVAGVVLGGIVFWKYYQGSSSSSSGALNAQPIYLPTTSGGMDNTPAPSGSTGIDPNLLSSLTSSSQALEQSIAALQAGSSSSGSAPDTTALAGQIMAGYLQNNPAAGSALHFTLGGTPYELDVGTQPLPAPAPGASSVASAKKATSVSSMRTSSPLNFAGLGLPHGAGGYLSTSGASAPTAGPSWMSNIYGQLFGHAPAVNSSHAITGGGPRGGAGFTFPTSPAPTRRTSIQPTLPPGSTVDRAAGFSGLSRQASFVKAQYQGLLPLAAHQGVSAPQAPAKAQKPASAPPPPRVSLLAPRLSTRAPSPALPLAAGSRR